MEITQMIRCNILAIFAVGSLLSATSHCRAEDFRQAILAGVNQVWRKAERTVLKHDANLEQAVQSHAERMARTGEMVHMQGEKPSGSIAFSSKALAANMKFLFKIKTKSGGIVGNILIEAQDVFAAITKLKKRYPGCEVLEVKEK